MRNNRLRKNNKGVTLVEVIAVIAVLGVVMAAVTGFMITGTKMSAKVSNEAGSSMREQTAVEFIQKTVLRYGSASLRTIEVVLNEEAEEKETVWALLIILATDGGQSSCALITATEDEKVVYQLCTVPISEDDDDIEFDNLDFDERDPIELCSGTISFEQITDDTVIYELNGEKHVVHLRVASPGS